MNTFSAIAFALAAIAIVIVLAAIYLKRHPQPIATVEKDWAGVHSKLDNILSSLHLVHQVASAPVTVALVPATQPQPQSAPAAAPAIKEAQPDSVIFDPAAYPDAGQRAAAAQALVASLRAKWGNTLTKVVSPRGYEIDVRGDEMLPDTGPSIDELTAADTLDFAKIGLGWNIKLKAEQNFQKKITNCPAKVRLGIFMISGDASAPAVCTGSVNGNPFHFGTSVVYETDAMGLTISGPDVVVKVDQPGMQFNIQQVA